MKGSYVRYAVGIILGLIIASVAMISLPLLAPTPPRESTTTLTTTTTTTTTDTITREQTKTETETTTKTERTTSLSTKTTIITSNVTTTSTATKTMERTKTITLTTTNTSTITTTLTKTTTKTTTAKSPSSGYLYSALLTNPAKLVQVDLATFTVKKILALSGNMGHVVTTDGSNVYVGMLSSPVRVVKVRVPDMVEGGYVDIDEDMPIAYIAFLNSKLYIATAGNGGIVEIDPATLTRGRTLTISGATVINGIILYGDYLYATTSGEKWSAPFYLVKIDPSSFTEVERIELTMAEGVDVGMREPIVVNDLIYVLGAGWPTSTRVFAVNPSTFTVQRSVDLPGSTAADRWAYDGRYLYINNDVRPGQIVRLDPVTLDYQIAVFGSGQRAADVDIGGGYIFSTCYQKPGAIAKIDIESFEWVKTLEFGAENDDSIQSVVVPA